MSTEKIIVKLDFHYAVNTNAQTFWKILYGISQKELDINVAEEYNIVKLLYTTKVANKTHWYNYYKLLSHPDIVKFKRIRISNRGNVSVKIYKPEELKVEGEELEKLLAILEKV